MNAPVVYTIGHSNHSFERFCALLERHGIEVVWDVRSRPGSRFAPHFSRPFLARHLPERGIRYVFAGEELGNDRFFRAGDGVRPDGRPIEALRRQATRVRLALMCAEEDPARCHRLLIADRLADMGLEVRHVRGDGRILRHDELPGEESDRHPDQPVLPGLDLPPDPRGRIRAVWKRKIGR